MPIEPHHNCCRLVTLSFKIDKCLSLFLCPSCLCYASQKSFSLSDNNNHSSVEISFANLLLASSRKFFSARRKWAGLLSDFAKLRPFLQAVERVDDVSKSLDLLMQARQQATSRKDQEDLDQAIRTTIAVGDGEDDKLENLCNILRQEVWVSLEASDTSSAFLHMHLSSSIICQQSIFFVCTHDISGEALQRKT